MPAREPAPGRAVRSSRAPSAKLGVTTECWDCLSLSELRPASRDMPVVSFGARVSCSAALTPTAGQEPAPWPRVLHEHGTIPRRARECVGTGTGYGRSLGLPPAAVSSSGKPGTPWWCPPHRPGVRPARSSDGHLSSSSHTRPPSAPRRLLSPGKQRHVPGSPRKGRWWSEAAAPGAGPRPQAGHPTQRGLT